MAAVMVNDQSREHSVSLHTQSGIGQGFLAVGILNWAMLDRQSVVYWEYRCTHCA